MLTNLTCVLRKWFLLEVIISGKDSGMPHHSLLETMDEFQVLSRCIIKAVSASALDCGLSLLDH